MTMNIKLLIETIVSLPKTFYFNFKYLPFKLAIKLPMFIDYKTRIINVRRGAIRFDCQVKPFIFKIGIKGSKGIVSNRYSAFSVMGSVVFKGKASFASGTSLRVDGKAIFGKNFSTNKNCFLSCTSRVVFGDDVLLGWNVTIRDSDGHQVLWNGKKQKDRAEITIGNHVWIASEVHILKGVTIGSGSIVGYRSTVTKSFPQNNILLGGYPAKILKDNIKWEIKV